ncbi:uncharacterized protein VP01_620g9 [Puccinia sorghi]|uniref:Myb/SANT-like domain-containing protein n=1 Tax=Puccinia sorghi TaxID=27349 RepID=A0A0L6UGL1_9BASI|nr:uncharacterized protein VP01_620g9 [Puccinia sorghi]
MHAAPRNQVANQYPRPALLRSTEGTLNNSQATEIPNNINNNNVHPDNLVILVPANSQTQTQKKLMWTGPMEMMMLDLYAGAAQVPEVGHVLDSNKVKSKLSQGFKKDYDTFLACKDASGFGWDESHPNAKKFQHLSLSLGSWILSLVCLALPQKQLVWLVSDSLNYSLVHQGLVKVQTHL